MAVKKVSDAEKEPSARCQASVLRKIESIGFNSTRALAFTPRLPVLKNIHLFRRNQDQIDNKPNIHSHYILWVCLSGEGILLVDRSREILRSFDALLVLPGQPHMRLPFEGRKVEWLLIRFDMEESESFSIFRHARFHLDEKSGDLLCTLLEAYERYGGDQQSANECGAALIHLLSQLNRLQTRSLFPESGAGLPEHLPNYIHELCVLMVQEPPVKDPFRQVAAKWNVTPEYLRIIFRREIGVSPRDFLNKKRKSLAQHLLVTTELSISEIGTRCGFSGIYPFSRFFSRQCGMSPTVYRKKFGKKTGYPSVPR